MKGADMKSGLAKLREELSDIEVDEYRDFFDLVDFLADLPVDFAIDRF